MPCLMVRGTAIGSSPRGWAASGAATIAARPPNISPSFLLIDLAPRARRMLRRGCPQSNSLHGIGLPRAEPGVRLRAMFSAPATAEPSAPGLAVPELSRPRLAFARLAARPRCDPVWVGNAELVLFQPADLVAQAGGFLELEVGGGFAHPLFQLADIGLEVVADEVRALVVAGLDQHAVAQRDVAQDRKSTRLNSSHGYISYAVFCLKKKKTKLKKMRSLQ